MTAFSTAPVPRGNRIPPYALYICMRSALLRTLAKATLTALASLQIKNTSFRGEFVMIGKHFIVAARAKDDALTIHQNAYDPSIEARMRQHARPCHQNRVRDDRQPTGRASVRLASKPLAAHNPRDVKRKSQEDHHGQQSRLSRHAIPDPGCDRKDCVRPRSRPHGRTEGDHGCRSLAPFRPGGRGLNPRRSATALQRGGAAARRERSTASRT